MSLPIGSIILWKNAAAALPSGWQVCDGTNGTPDLRGMFVYGATADGDVGATQANGNHVHARSAESSAAGDHRHYQSVSIGPTGGNTNARSAPGSGVNVAANSHGHDAGSGYSGYQGANHVHAVGGNTNTAETLPPYVLVYYAMRVQ